MNLVELINEHCYSDAVAENWETVASTLNSLTQTVIDNTLRNAKWIMVTFNEIKDVNTGATEADIILGTLQAATFPRVKAAYDTLCSEGIDLSNDQVQTMLPLIAQAGGWPDGLVERVLQAGKREVPIITTTADDCRVEWTKSILHKIPDEAYQKFITDWDTKYKDFLELYNATKNGIDNGVLTTTEQVKTVLEGV